MQGPKKEKKGKQKRRRAEFRATQLEKQDAARAAAGLQVPTVDVPPDFLPSLTPPRRTDQVDPVTRRPASRVQPRDTNAGY